MITEIPYSINEEVTVMLKENMEEAAIKSEPRINSFGLVCYDVQIRRTGEIIPRVESLIYKH